MKHDLTCTCLSFLILLLFIAVSCNQTEPPLQDDIEYTNLIPDAQLTTIREYYMSMNPYCDPLPLPNDSTAIFSLDLNGDSVVDFNFILEHYQQTINEYCGHCGIFHIKRLRINPSQADAYVSTDTLNPYLSRYYSEGEEISGQAIWSSEKTLIFLKDGCMIPVFYFTEAYIGLRVKNQTGWVNLQTTSNNGLIIKDYCINRSDNRPILAGQRE